MHNSRRIRLAVVAASSVQNGEFLRDGTSRTLPYAALLNIDPLLVADVTYRQVNRGQHYQRTSSSGYVNKSMFCMRDASRNTNTLIRSLWKSRRFSKTELECCIFQGSLPL